LCAVALREAKLDCKSVVISFSSSKAENKMATSVTVAVVALRESKVYCMLLIALFNELNVEFMAVMFASVSSSLSLSVFISAMMSSRVAGCAITVKEFGDTVAAEKIDTIRSIIKKIEKDLLCILVSPNLVHLQVIDTTGT